MRAIKAFRKSSSFTLSIIFTSMLMLAVLFVTYILVIANDDLLIRESEAAINADILGFHALHNTSGTAGVTKEILSRINNDNSDFFYHYRNADSNFITGNIQQWPAPSTEHLKNGVLKLMVGEEGPKQTKINVLAKIITFNNQEQLLIGRNIEEIELAQWVGKTFGWLMILILCLISATSIWVAHYVVTRINDISEKTDEIIATGNLSARLPIDSQWDDLSKLSISLNHMLSEFQQSVISIRSVSDSIAHDLRTPLTRLRNHIEDIDESAEKQIILGEVDNLLSIFNSLLRISEIETEQKRSEFKLNNVSTILDDVVDLYHPVIEAKNINLEVHTDLNQDMFLCDKNLLFQAFANIIDNALKFTLEYGEIQIALFNTDVMCTESIEQRATNKKPIKTKPNLVFTVFDSGIGVTKADIEKLTQRFYRADKSRTHAGNGLGLALVAAVVSLHEGELKFIDDPLQKGNGLGCLLCMPA